MDGTGRSEDAKLVELLAGALKILEETPSAVERTQGFLEGVLKGAREGSLSYDRLASRVLEMGAHVAEMCKPCEYVDFDAKARTTYSMKRHCTHSREGRTIMLSGNAQQTVEAPESAYGNLEGRIRVRLDAGPNQSDHEVGEVIGRLRTTLRQIPVEIGTGECLYRPATRCIEVTVVLEVDSELSIAFAQLSRTFLELKVDCLVSNCGRCYKNSIRRKSLLASEDEVSDVSSDEETPSRRSSMSSAHSARQRAGSSAPPCISGHVRFSGEVNRPLLEAVQARSRWACEELESLLSLEDDVSEDEMAEFLSLIDRIVCLVGGEGARGLATALLCGDMTAVTRAQAQLGASIIHKAVPRSHHRGMVDVAADLCDALTDGEDQLQLSSVSLLLPWVDINIYLEGLDVRDVLPTGEMVEEAFADAEVNSWGK